MNVHYSNSPNFYITNFSKVPQSVLRGTVLDTQELRREMQVVGMCFAMVWLHYQVKPHSFHIFFSLLIQLFVCHDYPTTDSQNISLKCVEGHFKSNLQGLVFKGQGPGISPGYLEHKPQLLSQNNSLNSLKRFDIY